MLTRLILRPSVNNHVNAQMICANHVQMLVADIFSRAKTNLVSAAPTSDDAWMRSDEFIGKSFVSRSLGNVSPTVDDAMPQHEVNAHKEANKQIN